MFKASLPAQQPAYTLRWRHREGYLGRWRLGSMRKRVRNEIEWHRDGREGRTLNGLSLQG